MKLNPRFATLFLYFFCITGCEESTSTSSIDEQTNAAQISAAFKKNSFNSLNWDGLYKGIIPCASCEGIETSIKLKKDKSYHMKVRYIGVTDEVFEKHDNFYWNENGNTITLLGISNEPVHYRVDENKITQLDIGGNTISGDLADKYVLIKQ